MKTPYRHADEVLKTLSDTIEQKFNNLSVTMRFDELNMVDVADNVRNLYSSIEYTVKQGFQKIATKVFQDAEDELGVEHSDFGEIDFVLAMLRRYDPVTKYSFENEWERKQDRLIEGLLASVSRRDMRNTLRKSANLLFQQVRQYADNITDEARREAFEEAGVDEVRWNTQNDEKVCSECAERDGVIYRIYKIPDKHYHCRCYLTAVQKQNT